jgi:hypothetical protein
MHHALHIIHHTEVEHPPHVHSVTAPVTSIQLMVVQRWIMVSTASPTFIFLGFSQLVSDDEVGSFHVTLRYGSATAAGSWRASTSRTPWR